MEQQEIQAKIVERFGLIDLPEAEQNAMIEKIMTSVMRRVLVVAGSKLSPADQDAFTDLVESDPAPQAIDAFFLEKLTDYGQIIEDAVNEMVAALEGTSA